MAYHIFESEKFKKATKKAVGGDKKLKKEFRQTIEELEADPYKFSHRLSSRFKGKRSVRIGNMKWRIILTICEECRKLEEENLNQCFECQRKDSNTVILRKFDKRSRVYER